MELRKSLEIDKEQSEKQTNKTLTRKKVALVGDAGTGKTALLDKILTGKMGVNNKSTQAANQESKEYPIHENTELLKIHWWDMPGQRGEGHGQVVMSRKNAQLATSSAGTILLCVNAQKFFAKQNGKKAIWVKSNAWQDALAGWYKLLQENGLKKEITPIYIVVTQIDNLPDPKMKDELKDSLVHFANKEGIKFKDIFLISSDTGEKVKDLEDQIVTTLTPPKTVVKVITQAPEKEIKEQTISESTILIILNRMIQNPTEDNIINEINDLSKKYKLNIIQKLKLLEKVFQPLSKRSNNTTTLQMIQRLYIGYLNTEPMGVKSLKLISQGLQTGIVPDYEANPLNEAIKTHVETSPSAKLLIDWAPKPEAPKDNTKAEDLSLEREVPKDNTKAEDLSLKREVPKDNKQQTNETPARQAITKLANGEGRPIVKMSINEDGIKCIADEIYKLIEEEKNSKKVRNIILNKIIEYNQSCAMTVIDKLKILEQIFQRIYIEDPRRVEVKAESNERNRHYLKKELSQIDTLKKLYVDFIAVEPYTKGRDPQTGEPKQNPINKDLNAHLATESANKLIDFQRTRYSFFVTDKTTTRVQLNSYMQGIGRPNEPSIYSLMLKYPRK